jgi:hypothetical protein
VTGQQPLQNWSSAWSDLVWPEEGVTRGLSRLSIAAE